jgi:alkylated DNA repair dioxygenase AlkB
MLDWHSDDEPLFGDSSTANVPILSFSIGATRTFLVRHNQSSSISKVELNNGDFCFMGGRMQFTHKHKVPTERHVSEARFNFTWRRIIRHTC